MALPFMIALFLFTARAEARPFERRIHVIEDELAKDMEQRWLNPRKQEASWEALIRLLKRSPTGAKLLAQAQKKAIEQGDSLKKILKVGAHSLTDTTLVRTFSRHKKKVSYRSRTIVKIDRRLSLLEAVLDLAHELAHFTLKHPFNPYRDSFNLGRFIASTIEGKGGEIEAYFVECSVLFELWPGVERRLREGGNHCHKILDGDTKKLSLEKAKGEFYKLGEHFKDFQKALHKHKVSLSHFHHTKRDEAIFISSVHALPYPLAAIYEYESIVERVCQNNWKRLRLLASSLSRERLHSLRKDFKAKCSGALTGKLSLQPRAPMDGQ